jgi:hypothetical protein
VTAYERAAGAVLLRPYSDLCSRAFSMDQTIAPAKTSTDAASKVGSIFTSCTSGTAGCLESASADELQSFK